jgi:taurine dioxygenase
MFEITPITGFFGAEISGVDLRNPLGDDVVSKLSDALGEHKVLVFRDQELGPAEQVAFARYFGDLLDVHPFHPHLDDFPEVTVLEFLGAEPNDGRSWHTDGATRANPEYISVLRAVDIPPYGRDTGFVDMEAAYDHLSEPLRGFLDGLTAEHAWGNQLPDVPPVEHPLVVTNPRTGRKAVYANRVYTKRIVGLRADESEALLELLFRQAMFPAYQLRVTWRPGTVVAWDNQSTQHHLINDVRYARVLHRVMVTSTAGGTPRG